MMNSNSDNKQPQPPVNMSQNQVPNQTRGRIIFLSVVALFAVPLLAAVWLYKNTQTGNPWATSNKGVLITPATPLESFALMPLHVNAAEVESIEQAYTLESLKTHWTMIYIAPQQCGEACKKNIYHMRQVWAGLGREAYRVQRLLLVDSEQQFAELQPFLQHYPEQLIAISHPGFAGQFNNKDKISPAPIYLVDPLGNLMMYFPVDLDPRSMLKDIKKLLKISKIG